MRDLIPHTQSLPTRLPDRQTSRTLGRLERQTVLRLASVRYEGSVQAEKLGEVDNLAREAMSGQALLGQWRDVLAAGDPLTADELNFFVILARAGKGEIIVDTIGSYCREGR